MRMVFTTEKGDKETAGRPLYCQRGEEEQDLGRLPFHQPDQLHQRCGRDAQERAKLRPQIKLCVEKGGVGGVDQDSGGQKPQARLKGEKHQSAAGSTQKTEKPAEARPGQRHAGQRTGSVGVGQLGGGQQKCQYHPTQRWGQTAQKRWDAGNVGHDETPPFTGYCSRRRQEKGVGK